MRLAMCIMLRGERLRCTVHTVEVMVLLLLGLIRAIGSINDGMILVETVDGLDHLGGCS